MLFRTLFVPVLFAASVALPDVTFAAPLSDTDRAITQQLHRYEQGLNASDTDAIMNSTTTHPLSWHRTRRRQ